MKIKTNFIFFLTLFLYVFLGAFYSIDSTKNIIFFSFFFLLLSNMFLSIRRIFLFEEIKLKYKGMFFLFFSSFFLMLISAIYNKSFELFIGILSFLFCFLFFSLNFSNRKVYEVFDLPVKVLFIICTLINFLYGFSFPFKGMFSNPNTLGGLYATISILASGVFLDKYKDLGKNDLVLVTILLLSIAFSLVSNSRISFLVSIVSLFFLLAFKFGGFITVLNKKMLFKMKKFSYLLVFFLILIAVTKIFFNYIYDIFIYKMIYKIEDGFSAGRSDIWTLIFENKKMFGHGRESLHLDRIGLAAHNTFMSLFDQFGYLSSFLFLIACFSCFFVYLKPSIIEKYGIMPLCIISGFLIMSTTESMVNKTIMFCLLAILNLGSYKQINKKC